MLRRTFLSTLAAVALAVPLVAATPAATAAADVTPMTITLTYDDSLAGEFKSAVASGVQVWNNSVVNVRIVRVASGSPANIRVIADDGWPRANLGPIYPGGRGTVWMGRSAVWQGYNPIRIAAHEFGHILGLPDNRTGRCSDLMSGSSAGTSCTNPYPNSTERSIVERNYAFAMAGATQSNARPMVVVDAG